MQFNQKFNIKITPHHLGRKDREVGSVYGKITIGDFYEYFYISPSCWTIKDYEIQWKLALERINNEANSCFITNIQATPLVEMWVLYRQNKTIYIQNYIFEGE